MCAGYAGWNYVQGLPMMRKANIKRAKASKLRASQQPARDANPGEWLQGTNFAKVCSVDNAGDLDSGLRGVWA